MSNHTTHTAFEEGTLSPRLAAQAEAENIRYLLAQQESIKAQLDAARDRMSRYVEAHGEAITAEGYRFEMTNAVEVTSYPAAEVDKFALWLVDNGYSPLAERLRALRRESARAGGLRVSKERTK